MSTFMTVIMILILKYLVIITWIQNRNHGNEDDHEKIIQHNTILQLHGLRPTAKNLGENQNLVEA